MRFVNWHDRKAVAAALKPIYQAADADAARFELEAFQASELGRKNPHTVATFDNAWERFTPFLAFPRMLRRVIYTTDEIVKIVLECRSADHPVTVGCSQRGVSSTAGHVRRSAGVVKMQRPTGRTILTAPSTGISLRPEEPRPHQTGARVLVGLVGCQWATKTSYARSACSAICFSSLRLCLSL
jgi:hypothetical protein